MSYPVDKPLQVKTPPCKHSLVNSAAALQFALVGRVRNANNL